MPRVLAIANQKGGVGKTTTAMALAHGLALSGRQTLLVDVDPQGNATSGMGCEVADHVVWAGPNELGSGIIHTPWQGVSLVPSAHDLERLATQGVGSASLLKEHLAGRCGGRFDVAIIDCPPSLGPVTQNALVAADFVVVPIQCEYYPLEGLVQLLAAVRQTAKVNSRLRVGGVLLTMYDPSVDLSAEVEAEVRGKLREPVFQTVIPRDVALAEAPSHGKSIFDYAPRSRGARAYAELVREVIDLGLAG